MILAGVDPGISIWVGGWGGGVGGVLLQNLPKKWRTDPRPPNASSLNPLLARVIQYNLLLRQTPITVNLMINNNNKKNLLLMGMETWDLLCITDRMLNTHIFVNNVDHFRSDMHRI